LMLATATAAKLDLVYVHYVHDVPPIPSLPHFSGSQPQSFPR
jgi:hypothetical protein